MCENARPGLRLAALGCLPLPKLEASMLTTCSGDQRTGPGTGRHGCLWGSPRIGRWLVSGPVSTQRNGAQMTHNPGNLAAAPPSRLSHDAVVTGALLTQHRAGAVAGRSEHGRSRRPCQPRATSSGGLQRTTTVTSKRPVGSAHIPDLGWGSRAKLHGMQWSAGLRRTQDRPWNSQKLKGARQANYDDCAIPLRFLGE